MINKKQSTKEFSERLKHVIAALGTTGREFSKRAGIGYSTVHNYMHGSSSPTLDNLVLLAKAGNVSIEWLATGQQSSMGSIDSDVTYVHSLRAIKVNTDVMTPTFLTGGVIIIDTNDINLTDNKLVVLKQSGNYLFKRVQVLIDGVRLLSDNDSYPPIAVPFEDMKSINVVGNVVMIINKIN